ncbi:MULTISPECIES: hypothetical protein [Mammaliicoccus]|uniref:hypothetical protein n=1 Tax=Mammaliicoccus TaxID=2803850 RepID=UPI0010103953|nr:MULTISPECIES: hypothetical protein [Mammaliicoccus]MDT0753975.1 hypothetical protein [Mammaliicoccus sciuri]MEB6231438.1 hypothetical protein [Mammaliicoccus sciuri]RXY85918.1 hypothetical protein DD607_32250 [Salmonella sp. 3DZ2-4SM]
MDIKKILNRDKKEMVNLNPLIESEIDELRVSALFIKTQKFFYENQISEEERKSLARMLNAYYN